MNQYLIKIHGIYIAAEHRVFGRSEENLNGEDLLSKEEVNLIADSGIEGDRFCKLRPDYNAHVTFFSQEVWDEVKMDLDLPETMGPELTRRNIIISGVDLKSLYGTDFEIGSIQFRGTIHCSPCPAMNWAIGPGATAALRARGGLRAQVKTNGVLKTGPGVLASNVVMDPGEAASQPPLPNLP